MLDPACGAGGFLASVTENLIKNKIPKKKIASNLYGIDKDTYLSQLAKVHIALLTGDHPNIINGDSLSLKADKNKLEIYFQKKESILF